MNRNHRIDAASKEKYTPMKEHHRAWPNSCSFDHISIGHTHCNPITSSISNQHEDILYT